MNISNLISIEILRAIKHTLGKRFYSETGEDAILFDIFKSKKGFYLDIGAAHPVIGSNTYGLYRRGWSGTGVDLLSEFSSLWKIVRRRDKFLVAAVSNKSGYVEFGKFKNRLLSTTDPKTLSFHINRGIPYELLKIKTIDPMDLLPKELDSSENFVLSIDIEGSEYQVLEHINFKKVRPRVICMESWGMPWENISPSHELLQRAGYSLYAYTGLSSFYVPNEAVEEIRGLRAKISN